MNTALDTMQVTRVPGPRPYPPAVSAFTAPFWQALGEGRLTTTGCVQCGRLAFPPKPFCPHCWHREVRWQPLVPQGVIYSATTVHAAPQVFRALSPYQVCIVDLDQGLRIATRLLGDLPCLQAIGGRVELVVQAHDDGPLFAARLIPTV